MKIAIGNDRKGLDYKKRLSAYLESQGYEIVNCGCDVDEPVDYPLFAFKVGELVASQKCDFGVLICSSGEGMVIAANKVKGIRCGLGYNEEVSGFLRMHNDANVIAFGQSFMTYEEVQTRTMKFLTTEFLGTYHQIRVNQIISKENERI